MEQKISIIIPVYNVEKHLSRCIESILKQTFRNIEIILIDDGSSDKCPQICDLYAKRDPRIKVLHKENAGAGIARNSGIELATGKFISFVDSDDYIAPNMFEKLYNEIEHKDVDAVFCNYYEVFDTGQRIKKLDIKNNHIIKNEEINTFYYSIISFFRPVVWRALFKADILLKYDLKFVSEREVLSEDKFFLLDYLKFCNSLAFITDCLYYYYINTNSLIHRYNPSQFNLLIKAYYKLLDYNQTEKWEYLVNMQFIEYSKTEIKKLCLSKNKYIKKRHLLKEILNMPILKKSFKKILKHPLPIKKKIFYWALCSKNPELMYFIGKHVHRK